MHLYTSEHIHIPAHIHTCPTQAAKAAHGPGQLKGLSGTVASPLQGPAFGGRLLVGKGWCSFPARGVRGPLLEVQLCWPLRAQPSTRPLMPDPVLLQEAGVLGISVVRARRGWWSGQFLPERKGCQGADSAPGRRTLDGAWGNHRAGPCSWGRHTHCPPPETSRLLPQGPHSQRLRRRRLTHGRCGTPAP